MVDPRETGLSDRLTASQRPPVVPGVRALASIPPLEGALTSGGAERRGGGGGRGASHADPRTTMRYDRGRQSLDRHATYIVATFIAGAAR